MNLDLLQEQNVVNVLLYSAVAIQWPSLNPTVLFSDSDIADGAAFNRFAINRMMLNFLILSTPECIDFLTDQNIEPEIKTLIRTLALYFYIRAHGGSIILNLDLFRDEKYDYKICKIIQDNRKLEEFLKNLIHTSICKKIFKNIINEEDESAFEFKLEELFNYAIDNSYYANLPKGLYGLTALDRKIFISSEYKEKEQVRVEEDIKIEEVKNEEEKKEEEKDEVEKIKEKLNNIEADEFRFGPTLIILLHEIAHLSTRLWRNQISYFIITPRELKCPSDSENSYGELGDYLESLLFYTRLKRLYSGAIPFLLNIENWNLPLDTFKDIFKTKQQKRKARKDKYCTLSRGKGTGNYVKFGRCGMSY